MVAHPLPDDHDQDQRSAGSMHQAEEDRATATARQSGASQRAARKPMTTEGIAAMISTVGLITARSSCVGELAGVDRAEQRQRHGEEHGVEGPLEGAEDQRHQAQFRFEVVVAGRGLPDIGRFVVALVPDLAEQRRQLISGCGIVELPDPARAGRRSRPIRPLPRVDKAQLSQRQRRLPSVSRWRSLVMWSRWMAPSSAG